MNIVILDAATLGDDIDLSFFSRFGSVTVYQTTSPEEMLARTASADVLILNKVRCDGESLKNAVALKLICVAATGYDNIDVDYCRTRGVGVCNVVGYSTDSVAAVTVSTIIITVIIVPVIMASAIVILIHVIVIHSSSVSIL